MAVNHDSNNVPVQPVYVPVTTAGNAPANQGVLNTLGGTAVLDANNNYAAAEVIQIGDKTTPTQTAAVDSSGRLSVNQGAGVPPAIVQKASAVSTGSVASIAPAFTSGNTKGNSIIVVLAVGNNSAVTIADTTGNTYTSAVLGANSTTFSSQIFYATNIAAGANTVTITNGGSAASMAAEIYEVSGLITQASVVLDQQSASNATSGTATTSALTPNDPNEIAFAGVAVGTAAQTITAAAGWSNDSGQQNPTTPAGLFSFASLSQQLPTLAPVTPKATFTSEPWAMAAATFRPVVLGVHAFVTEAGWNYTNITTATTTLIKNGPGVLHLIAVNTLVGSATVEMDDALTHTTPKIGTVTLPGTITSALPTNLFYDVNFTTGLSITTSGATDITVVWR